MSKVEIMTFLIILLSLGMKKNLLTTLLRLEILCLLIIVIMLKNGIDMFFRLILICIGACEGAVGLRSLIRMRRMGKMYV